MLEIVQRRLPNCSFFAAVFLLSGCDRAPSFNVLGSYFPAWLVCILAGIAGASLVSLSLAKIQMEYLMRWTIVVYPCLSGSIAFTLWLLLFS
jgi:hypothetical protein